MTRLCICRRWIISVILSAVVVFHVMPGFGKDSSAARPYFLFFISSLDQLLDDFEVVFESVGREDLADSLDQRLKGLRNFAGIDHSKPLGLMSMWDEAESFDIVFLPVEEIDQLLKTATFEIVGYHEAGPNRYEIERPGAPYHVLVRNDYAMLADSIATIQALRLTPDQLTRDQRKRFEVALVLDLKQIPQTIKTQFVRSQREQIEPWLQMQDDEVSEAGNLRRAFGAALLDLVERTVMDTTMVRMGIHLDHETHQFAFEATIEASKDSPTAKTLNRWSAKRSDFSALVSSDVPAGIAINLPLGGFVDQILGNPATAVKNESNLNAGLQIVGESLGRLSIILALSGDDAKKLNDALPDVIGKLDKSGHFRSFEENADVHRGTVLHTAVPTGLPEFLTNFVGHDAEIVIGQGKSIVWLGIGHPESIMDDVIAAIDDIDVPQAERPGSQLVRARLQAAQVPELISSNLLIPNVDDSASRKELAKGKDGFSLIIEPIENGIKIRLEAEEGLVRLVGRDWVKRVENADQ